MSAIALQDAAGRRRSPATLPRYLAGRPPRNKGVRSRSPRSSRIASPIRMPVTASSPISVWALAVGEAPSRLRAAATSHPREQSVEVEPGS